MKTCIGYGEYKGACGNAPDLDLNPSGLWCTRCELLRRETITAQLEDLANWFERRTGLLSSHHDTGGTK